MSGSIGMGGSVISKNILNYRGKLKWCIREKPINNLDNGWRFFSDIDTDDFLSDPSNMAICDWGTIIDIEPAVLVIFDMPIGTDIALVEAEGKKSFIYTNTGKNVIF